MFKKLTQAVRESKFKTWTALNSKFRLSDNVLQRRIKRDINKIEELNEILELIGYKVEFRKIKQ